MTFIRATPEQPACERSCLEHTCAGLQFRNELMTGSFRTFTSLFSYVDRLPHFSSLLHCTLLNLAGTFTGVPVNILGVIRGASKRELRTNPWLQETHTLPHMRAHTHTHTYTECIAPEVQGADTTGTKQGGRRGSKKEKKIYSGWAGVRGWGQGVSG